MEPYTPKEVRVWPFWQLQVFRHGWLLQLQQHAHNFVTRALTV